MEPEGSYPHSQEPVTYPYSEPDRSSPCLHPIVPRSILILSFHFRVGLPSGLLPSGLPTKTFYVFLLTLIHFSYGNMFYCSEGFSAVPVLLSGGGIGSRVESWEVERTR